MTKKFETAKILEAGYAAGVADDLYRSGYRIEPDGTTRYYRGLDARLKATPLEDHSTEDAFDVPQSTPLPTEAAARKAVPIASGVLDYFPDALAAIAHVSRVGGEQHNPGKPLHWDRSKSTDEGDALIRHFLERGTLDTDGCRHSAKVAWRALALLQKEIENDRTPRDKKQQPE